MSLHDVIVVQDGDQEVAVAPADRVLEHVGVLRRLARQGPPQEPAKVRLQAATLGGGRTPIGGDRVGPSGTGRGRDRAGKNSGRNVEIIL